MKWKIILMLLLAGGGLAFWFHAGSREEPPYATREIPVAGPQQKEVLRLARELVRIYNEQGASTLEPIFIHDRTKRLIMKTETGDDPVEKSLDVLKKNGSRLTLREAEVKCLSNAENQFIIRCELKQDGSPVRIFMRKTAKGYFLSEIREL